VLGLVSAMKAFFLILKKIPQLMRVRVRFRIRFRFRVRVRVRVKVNLQQ
jgi:hypothetical protein